MPDIIRKGVTISEAYQEAAAQAPVDRAMLACYELWHASLSAPVRFVNDTQAMTATLESTAPRNASAAVEFLACPLEKISPDENDSSAVPSIQLSRPDVAGLLKEALDTARGSLTEWTLIERIYASDDTSTPAKLPVLTFEVTSFDLSIMVASFTASYGDWVNVAVPKTTFKRSEYPGLGR